MTQPTAPAAYPLTWPQGRPRTKIYDRREGKFSSGGRAITMAAALDRLQGEVDRIGGLYPLLSSNVPTRIDGLPRSGMAEPSDPGAALYFTRWGKPYVLACDTYTKLAQNIAAIANHIEATRRIERYGVASAEEMLQAFQALPPPPDGGSIMIGEAVKHWSEVLGLDRMKATVDTVSAVYRTMARTVATDEEKLRNLNLARDAALREIGDRK